MARALSESPDTRVKEAATIHLLLALTLSSISSCGWRAGENVRL